MAVRNRVELKAYIRFQLSQLSARNAEHEFENLAFELARLRVVSNLLPATGPVQAGGDQGRDFETYRSYLAGSPLTTSAFVTTVSTNSIVGACTLDKKIVQKIKKDLRTIFGSGYRPAQVAYFCETDLPVAKRHDLQDLCQTTYGASLEIFDGQAISDLLADRDTFWIAEHFLAIPADAWPDEPVDARYAAAREKWIDTATPPRNYADYLDIKQGLRTAILAEEAKRDLIDWLNVMRLFLGGDVPDRLAQKVRYEIAVAELRGRGSLDPALTLVEQFFDCLSSDRASAEILDAAVLAVYARGAQAHGKTSVAPDTVNNWVRKTGDIVTSALAAAPSRGDRCMLLEARAMLGSAPHGAEVSSGDYQSHFFDLWHQVVQQIKNTPFYPVTHVADVLERLTPVFGTHPKFRSLVDEVDALVAERAGAGAVAERAQKRAIAHLDAGRHVFAIDELQRTKIGWFTGETMNGSILAMLVTSQSFEALHLHFAARYYAAGAFFLALNYDDEQVKRRLGSAAFRLADTFHAAGEGITFFYSLGQALLAHETVASEPDDWTKHSTVQRSMAHAAILRAVARRIACRLLPLIDAAIAKWPLPESERNAFIELSEAEPWSTIPIEEIERRIAEQLGKHPFGDVGDRRSATWSALGVSWTIRSMADRESWCAALEVAATLQIAQVEFADADLIVIPSHALLDVELGDVKSPQIFQQPDNGSLIWQIVMPRDVPSDVNDLAAELGAIAITVLAHATALSSEKFHALCEQKFERGLALRLFSVRPARELMRLAHPDDLDSATLSSLPVPTFESPLHPIEASELRWRTGPGPGYTAARAEEYLRNRYERLSRALRFTLPRLLKDERCSNIVAQLKTDGLLDWQILAVLANIVGQYQVEQQVGGVISPEMASKISDRLYREERVDDPTFDLSRLTDEIVEVQKRMLSAVAFRTWDLASHRRTPDFDAMKRLLDERYRHSSDDIPHKDPFSGLSDPPLAA